MIREATSLEKEFRVDNPEWFNGEFDTYKINSNRNFRFVTVAKALHLMDREKVLGTLYEIVSYGDGVAIIDKYSTNKEFLSW